MPDPVLAFIVIASFFATLAAASWFKTLDPSLGRAARIPVLAGLAAGVLIRLTGFLNAALTIGITLTIAALYVRLTGRESEPIEGMTLGAMTGAAAAIPLAIGTDQGLMRFAECVTAGSVAGYGITFGLTHVRDKVRQAAIDAITAGAAIAAAVLPALILRLPRVTEKQVAFGTAALIPLIVLGAVFRQWPSIAKELRDEAALGVMDDEDVRLTAHPFRRLGRGAWFDAGAHRQFVRIANRIALRKRQQRNRPEDVARLYQLEVIKLRMELQQMASIDRAMRGRGATAGAEAQGER